MTNPQYYKSAIDGSGCISNAWELIKTNYWLYLGMTFVSGLILVALSFIPIVGIVAVAPLTGGLYFAYLRAMRGEYVDFGMLFKGFEKFVPLLIIGLVQGIPSIIVQILQLFLNLASLAIPPNSNRDISFYQSGPAEFPLAGGLLVVAIIAFLILLLFSIAWTITFTFAIPIAMDQDVDALTAIKLSARAGWSNVGGIIVLAILIGLIFLVSMIAICLLGPLWVSPLYIASWAFAYRQVFPDLGPTVFRNEPPPPSAYQGSFGQGL